MDWKIEVVLIPVSDLDAAKAFYSERLGFNVDHDTQISETQRIIQLTPPGSGCSVVVGDGLTSLKPGSMQGMQITVSDLDAARAQLVDQGVGITAIQHHDGTGFVEGRGGDWNNFCFFSDPDGNGWALQESPKVG